MKIAQRVKEVAPSLTLEVTSLAKKMKQQGQDVVNFGAGEPDFDTPEHIKEAAIKAIRGGYTKYTPASGALELKQAICDKFKQDNSLTYSPSQVIISSGAKHTLYNILQVLCEKDDEVITISPFWVSYPEMIKLACGKVRVVETSKEEGFKLTKKLLLSVITKKTKVLILNSPSNPAGIIYTREELGEIAKIAIEKNLYVISDEIYEELIYDGKKHVSIASINDEIFKRTIVVNGVSKAYAMTGWRIGYLGCIDEEIVKAIGSLQSHSTSNPCSISQKAALEALTEPQDQQMAAMVEEFQLRRDCMFEGLNEIKKLKPLKPEGAFYIFCDISKTGLDSMSFARNLLQEAKVAVIPGIAFGRDDYIRLSFTTNQEQIKKGIDRIKDWVEKL